MANRLINENSPYLRQHADNPLDAQIVARAEAIDHILAGEAWRAEQQLVAALGLGVVGGAVPRAAADGRSTRKPKALKQQFHVVVVQSDGEHQSEQDQHHDNDQEGP